MKSGIHRQTMAVFTAVAALVVTTQFAEAKKPDPLVTAAVTAATANTDIESITTLQGIPTADMIGSGAIKLSTTNVNALVKGLADAIGAKLPLGTTPDPNRIDNKKDEIGELAAFVFEALAGNPKLTKLGNAKKYALAVMKSALKTALKPGDLLATTIVNDVVGSVALTIHNDVRLDAIETKLAKSLKKASKSIAGKKNKNIVSAALDAGFAGGATFEDGNVPSLTTVSDPETDFRNA